MKLALVMLAHDPAPRFHAHAPKVLHPLAGRPMLRYTLDLAHRLKAHPILVSAPQSEAALRAVAGEDVPCVTVPAAEGLAGALHRALVRLETPPDALIALPPDMPLLRVETLQALLEQRASDAVPVLRLGTTPVFALGREAALKCRTQELPALEGWLKPFTEAPGAALTDDALQLLRIETRVDLSRALQALRIRINERWMLTGVTLIDPATTYIDVDVTIGPETVIAPNTHLRGATTIGEACQIGPNTLIESCTIGDRCKVLASVLEYAIMEDDSDIGPFGHLRKGARLCEGAHMGNFGEMKNSTLGPGAKMGHFSYLGDAEVGAGANIGAGTITCNYDGKRKHRTTIEEGAFIGSDTLLVAPVTVGAHAKTGAGSVVTHDLPSGSLAYGVPARVKREGMNDTEEKHDDNPDDQA
ncbi:MAG: NTP transferase domain-containing protein [Anaerolineae bacterium]